MSESAKKQYASGCAKRSVQNKRKLEAAGSDPKQAKLSFGINKPPVSRTANVETPLQLEGVVSENPENTQSGLIESDQLHESSARLSSASGCTSSQLHSLRPRPRSRSPSPSISDVELRKARSSSAVRAASAPGALGEGEAEAPFSVNEDVLDDDDPIHYHSDSNVSESSSQQDASTTDLSQRSHPDLVYFVPPGKGSSLGVKKVFLSQHPIQPVASPTVEIDFDTNKAYFREHENQKIRRNWLSYCKENCSLYSSTCMAFATTDRDRDSPFVTGYNVSGRRKDVYHAINCHESCKAHLSAVGAHIKAMADKDVATLIDVDLQSIISKQKETRRLVISRVTDICIFIGRQGIAYRGSDEAAYSLENRPDNHGNFLELVLLLAEFDPVLKEHVKQSIELGKKRRDAKKGSKGRGSIVTFLSKSSVNKIIKIIAAEIQETILTEVKDARIFSLQVDSTQDCGVLDQLAVVVRYTDVGRVKERPIKIAVSHDNSGQGLFNLLKTEFEIMGLDLRNCIACSFDGAANMSGCYMGLQARLKEINPDLQFTHCAAHCLNLVMSDTCKDCNECKKLFGLVETGAVFISDSYKRMDVWVKTVKKSNTMHNKLRRLRKAGATRWWGKDRSLRSVLDDDCEVGDHSNFIDFLTCMNEIRNSNSFDEKASYSADCIIKSWTKFETLLTAFLMMEIFDCTTPVSEALQSTDLDYLVTYGLVEGLLDRIGKKRGQFESLVSIVTRYATKINEELEKLGIDIELECDFQDIRGRKCKNPHVETARDVFRVNTFNVVLDRVTMGLRERFTPNEPLLRDCAALDPKRYTQLEGKDDNFDILNTVAKLAKADLKRSRSELLAFASAYDKIVQTELGGGGNAGNDDKNDCELDFDLNNDDDDTVDQADEDKDEDDMCVVKCKACSKCLACALKLFYTYPMLQSSYPNLLLCYKYVLTIPTTQVSCERVFSKVKLIKTRLRSMLTQELFESLLLMSVERLLASMINKTNVVNKFANSSAELRRLIL